MSGLTARLVAALPGIFAVGTLPAGLLALLFLGWQAGLAAFVIGWLLLVPVTAILSEEVFDGERSDADSRAESEREPSTTTAEARAESDDPLEILRDRYARGELDDDEFERALETLVESENADPEALLERRRREGDRDRDRHWESEFEV